MKNVFLFSKNFDMPLAENFDKASGLQKPHQFDFFDETLNPTRNNVQKVLCFQSGRLLGAEEQNKLDEKILGHINTKELGSVAIFGSSQSLKFQYEYNNGSHNIKDKIYVLVAFDNQKKDSIFSITIKRPENISGLEKLDMSLLKEHLSIIFQEGGSEKINTYLGHQKFLELIEGYKKGHILMHTSAPLTMLPIKKNREPNLLSKSTVTYIIDKDLSDIGEDKGELVFKISPINNIYIIRYEGVSKDNTNSSINVDDNTHTYIFQKIRVYLQQGKKEIPIEGGIDKLQNMGIFPVVELNEIYTQKFG